MSDIFKDPEVGRIIAETGFFKGDLLRDTEVEQLRSSYKKLMDLLPGKVGSSFWPSGRSDDPAIRNFARSEIEQIVPRALDRYVIGDRINYIGGTFLIKPPSRKSSLSPHQDSSHVDERHGFSVFAWIPLQHVNRWNGCFHYLPGSHHWGIHQRSLNVKWQLDGYRRKLNKKMKPIPMKAGEVLLFHSALIHSSPPNYSFRTRVAVNYYLHPADSPFLHFYEDEQTPEGKVEMFEVTPEFFYDHNFEQRPAEQYKRLDIIDKAVLRETTLREL